MLPLTTVVSCWWRLFVVLWNDFYLYALLFISSVGSLYANLVGPNVCIGPIGLIMPNMIWKWFRIVASSRWTIESNLHCLMFSENPRPTRMFSRTPTLLLLSVCLGMLASSAARPLTQQDNQAQAQMYTQLRSYLVHKLATLTEEQKLLFARKLWNRIHCRKVRTTKIGPWVNDDDSLARMLWITQTRLALVDMILNYSA